MLMLFQNHNAKSYLSFRKSFVILMKETLHFQNLDRQFKNRDGSGKVQN